MVRADGGVPAAALRRRLYDEYRVEVPILSWSGRQLVRVSVQDYNTLEDVQALVRALANLLARPARLHGHRT